MHGDGGRFGRWVGDDPAAAAFALERPDHLEDLVLPEGGWDRLWHQVGSPGLTATAHAGGGTTLWATARGMVRLTDDRPVGRSPDAPTAVRACTWEHAAASWEHAVDGSVVRRCVAAATDDAPALHVTVSLDEGAAGPVRWVEGWHPRPWPLLVGGLMSRHLAPPPGYGPVERLTWHATFGVSHASRVATDRLRTLLGRRLRMTPASDAGGAPVVRWQPRRPIPTTPPTTPAWYDEALPIVVVAGLDDRWRVDRDELWCELEPGGRHELVVALVDHDAEVAGVVEAARRRTEVGDLQTRPRLVLREPAAPSLERETAWHATMLRGALQRDALWDRSFVSQGSAYAYLHGLHGAPRDEAIFSVPLTWTDPAAARDQLECCLQMVRPSGGVAYAHTGRGMLTDGGIHAAPTDLPLFLLWAVTEHVWATGALAWLDERLPFAPHRRVGDRGDSTVRERLLLLWARLRDHVGVGPTGLVRVGSGDWADPISAMVPDRRAFHERGESAFNTAFAAYVLPRAARLLAPSAPAVAAAMTAWADERSAALAATWNGRWFPRGTDGTGGRVGDEHLFLDANALCLLARIGTDDQRAELVAQVAQRCIRPSPIGGTILDRPHPVRLGMLAPGWDCNGGVWAAVNAFAAMGLAEHDAAVAWDLVGRQSLAAHARAYPDVWYGIWSGPDAYNAHFGSRPGETFVQPATPMAEYPVMNANAHAGPLLALLAVLGVQATPDGPVVVERPPPVPTTWELETALGTLSPSGLRQG